MFAKITVIVVTAIALASPVAAKTSQSAPQIAVNYGDLDLTTAQGETALNGRLLMAAEALCPRDPGLAELARHRIAMKCISDTRVHVNQQVAAAVSASRMARHGGQEVAAR